MKSMHALSVLLAVASIAGSVVRAEEIAASDQSITAEVTAGSFRLFREPDYVPNPECNDFIVLRLTTEGWAYLDNGISGACAAVALIHHNPRGYRLDVTVKPCGIKVYESSRRIAFDFKRTEDARLKITDYRINTCDVEAAAPIVLEEDSAIWGIWYSSGSDE